MSRKTRLRHRSLPRAHKTAQRRRIRCHPRDRDGNSLPCSYSRHSRALPRHRIPRCMCWRYHIGASCRSNANQRSRAGPGHRTRSTSPWSRLRRRWDMPHPRPYRLPNLRKRIPRSTRASTSGPGSTSVRVSRTARRPSRCTRRWNLHTLHPHNTAVRAGHKKRTQKFRSCPRLRRDCPDNTAGPDVRNPSNFLSRTARQAVRERWCTAHHSRGTHLLGNNRQQRKRSPRSKVDRSDRTLRTCSWDHMTNQRHMPTRRHRSNFVRRDRKRCRSQPGRRSRWPCRRHGRRSTFAPKPRIRRKRLGCRVRRAPRMIRRRTRNGRRHSTPPPRSCWRRSTAGQEHRTAWVRRPSPPPRHQSSWQGRRLLRRNRSRRNLRRRPRHSLPQTAPFGPHRQTP
jgi:hypothetical protein